jgi:hypothetical protein
MSQMSNVKWILLAAGCWLLDLLIAYSPIAYIELHAVRLQTSPFSRAFWGRLKHTAFPRACYQPSCQHRRSSAASFGSGVSGSRRMQMWCPQQALSTPFIWRFPAGGLLVLASPSSSVTANQPPSHQSFWPCVLKSVGVRGGSVSASQMHTTQGQLTTLNKHLTQHS